MRFAVFLLSLDLSGELMLTAGVCHDRGHNPGSQGREPSTLPLSYPAIRHGHDLNPGSQGREPSTSPLS